MSPTSDDVQLHDRVTYRYDSVKGTVSGQGTVVCIDERICLAGEILVQTEAGNLINVPLGGVESRESAESCARRFIATQEEGSA